MTLRLRNMSVLPVLLLGSVLFFGCSDDDDGGTGPVNNGEAIELQLRAGDYFEYNVWELDENNNRVGDSKPVRVRYVSNGGAILDGFTDWVVAREEELPSQNQIADFRVRADAQSNLYIYAFQHDLYTEFFDLLKEFDPSIQVPSIGYQKWDLVAKFNDDAGNALPKNTEWMITAETMEPFNVNVTIGGFPVSVSVLPEIKGIYEGQIDPVTVKGTEVKQWQTRVVIVMKIRSAVLDKDFTIEQTVTYSNEPDGQINVKRNSATLDFEGVGSYTQPGEERELYTFVKF